MSRAEFEEWRDFPDDPNYQVSSLGRVRGKTRKVFNRTAYEKILKISTSKKKGYQSVATTNSTRRLIHRMVAITFIPNLIGKGAQVNHKDGNKTNNRVDNLEWVTPSQNELHSYAVLGKKPTWKGIHGEKHPATKAVIATCLKTGKKIRYASGMDAVREGFKSDCISRCCNGISAFHYGFLWEFEEKEK